MIPSTFTLLVAATSTVLSANALPIFSGFFASPATPAPAVQRRDLTDGQLAQGTNAFFGTLLLEDVCTPGQVGCINNNTATCSPEGNWEITPCPSSTTCLALPASADTSSQSLVVKCTTQATAVSAIEQAGGSQDLAVDYSITSAPFNATVVDIPGSDNNSTDTNTDIPTGTDSFTDVPTATETDVPSATCTPDDGSDNGNDGSDDGSNDGSNDGSDDGSIPTDVPTGTDAGIAPTGTCTDEPSEPTETEYITVIAFPDPSNTDSFTFSTIEPTDAATITLPDESTPTDTITQVAPVDQPTDSLTDTAFPTDTTTDTSLPTGTDAGVPAPTDTTPCVHPDPAQTSADSTTDSVTATETATEITTATGTDSGEPTTLVVPPNFSIATGPVPDINTVGTFAIPAPSPSAPVPIRRSGRMQRKVRRS